MGISISQLHPALGADILQLASARSGHSVNAITQLNLHTRNGRVVSLKNRQIKGTQVVSYKNVAIELLDYPARSAQGSQAA